MILSGCVSAESLNIMWRLLAKIPIFDNYINLKLPTYIISVITKHDFVRYIKIYLVLSCDEMLL